MEIPWIRKHQPIAKDIPQAGVSQVRDFLTMFKKQKKKAVLLYGPSGTGKTTAVHALANELGLEVLEVNASDVRNADNVQSKIGIASQQMSLFSRGKIILVDEVDALSGHDDRGGLGAIASVIANTKFPIVLIANDPWDPKLSSLRNKCQLIEFGPVDYLRITDILKKICVKEGIDYDELSLKTLARRVGGDIRASINDLQTLACDTKKFTNNQLEQLGERDKEERILTALTKVFKNSDPAIAVTAFDNVNEDLDGAFLWIDENLPKEYTNPLDLARAYDALAKADVYRGRIRKRQHWHFLVYVNTLLSAGVAVAKDLKYSGFKKFCPTTRLLKIWQANMRYNKRKAIAEKIAQQTHSSVKRTIKELPFIQVLFKVRHSSAKNIADQADLDQEEVAWLTQ